MLGPMQYVINYWPTCCSVRYRVAIGTDPTRHDVPVDRPDDCSEVTAWSRAPRTLAAFASSSRVLMAYKRASVVAYIVVFAALVGAHPLHVRPAFILCQVF